MDRTCQPANGECTASADCVAPGPCEVAEGSVCQGGACIYLPFACSQGAPLDPCLASEGTCDPTLGGVCLQQSCCVFPPRWSSGSLDPAPACPLAGDDANGDGMLGLGEEWAGRCEHTGACIGCTTLAQCADTNACTLDDCVDGRCVHDTSAKLGVPCAVVASGDAVCVADGQGIACRLIPGQPCVTDTDCVAQACECANDGCSSRACHEAGCATCEYSADGLGLCDPTSATLAGEDCTAAGTACTASRQCGFADGLACTADAQCGSGHCECVDLFCGARLCSPVACPCAFNQTGDSLCDGALAAGTDDPETCSGTAASCTAGACYDLVYQAHGQAQCIALSGVVVSDASNSFCRFALSGCPSGWTAFQSWSTTTAGSATYYNEAANGDNGFAGGCCGQNNACTLNAATCSTSSHTWSNAATESAACSGTNVIGGRDIGSCDNGTCGSQDCTGATSVTPSATRTQIGCY
ncbi:MAG: hypothetical protein AAB426_02820 [Myxococcota bacterium]